MKSSTALALVLTALAGQGLAQEDDFEPEVLTEEARIPEGPNFLVMDQAWTGPSKINVLGAEDFAIKGNIGVGTTGQMALAPDGQTLYTASVYFERYSYGDLTAVIQEYDVPTLSMRREIEISDKLAQVESQPGLLSLVDGGAYLLAQNATPATSISVIDLEAGEQIAEIPTPGCWAAIPAAEGRRFTTLCGDGTMESITFEPDGSHGTPAASEVIFDPDADALFTNPVRTPHGLVFASFGGNLYVVDDSDGAPALVETLTVADSQLGHWAPGGSEVLGYSAATDTAFLLMHDDAYEGSHKDPAEEIWAVDLESGEVVGRSAANEETGIVVDRSDPPLLYTAGEGGGVHRYATETGEQVSISEDGAMDYVGDFLTIMAVDR